MKAQRTAWLCRTLRLDLTRPRVMGIVNVTPDSFSDGGRWFDAERAIEHGLRLAAEGADILDIGGVSTRPGADAVDAAEELRRVLPVVQGLARQTHVPLSVDTFRADVAREAVAAGASIVNDVAPLDGDAEMAAAVRETGAGLVLMHSRGTPQDMMRMTDYADVAGEVKTALAAALAYAHEQGIAEEACVIDPGLGFAKTAAQNVTLLQRLGDLTALAPVLVGASRKRFIGELCGEAEPSARLGGSVGVAVWSALHGASVVRAHDVKETAEALRVVGAIVRMSR